MIRRVQHHRAIHPAQPALPTAGSRARERARLREALTQARLLRDRLVTANESRLAATSGAAVEAARTGADETRTLALGMGAETLQRLTAGQRTHLQALASTRSDLVWD